MKNYVIAVLVFFCSFSSMLHAAGGNFGGGNGTEINPYIIEDAADLLAVNNRKTASYRLNADIDLSGYNFSDAPIQEIAAGHFDGNGHVVKNLKITGDATIGLFGILKYCSVSNLGVIDADITGRQNVCI